MQVTRQPSTALSFFLWGLALLVSLPGPSRADGSPVIGVLTPGGRYEAALVGFREALERHGYRQAKLAKYLVEDTRGEELDLLGRAKRIVEAKPDLIFTLSTEHSLAAKQATQRIPVVFANVGDPLGSGLVAGYTSSKNNLTGVASMVVPLTGKRLELLKEAVPRVRRVLALVVPKEVNSLLSLQVLDQAAKQLAIQALRRDVATKEELEKALGESERGSFDGILFMPSLVVGTNIDLLIKRAKEDKVPLMTHQDYMVERGALISYGADVKALGGQAARLAAKLLKGDKPAEVPVETPDRLFVTVNLATAKAIGIKFPPVFAAKIDRTVK